MRITPEHFKKFLTFLLVVGLLAVNGWETPIGATDPSSLSLAPSEVATETQVTLNIKNRKFDPETIMLTPNQKTRLTVINHDSELHAFVPVGLLSHTHINLSGNGAPQFGKEGLLRVLLPTRGQTDIVFIPTRPGNYPFFCDLPGHVMRGNIVVQEK
ncbi:MAG: cupredoxin domain-containing protein [Nitrospirales bacterium]